jgi:hypothetical protein
VIEKVGAASSVVWNPCAEKAATMADLGDPAWRGMVCLQTGNVADNVPAALARAVVPSFVFLSSKHRITRLTMPEPADFRSLGRTLRMCAFCVGLRLQSANTGPFVRTLDLTSGTIPLMRPNPMGAHR